MKYYIYIIAVFCSIVTIHAQHQHTTTSSCITTEPLCHMAIDSRLTAKFTDNNQPLVLRVRYVFVTNKQKQLFNVSDPEFSSLEMTALLNKHFNKHQIFFKKSKVIYLDDPSFYYSDSEVFKKKIIPQIKDNSFFTIVVTGQHFSSDGTAIAGQSNGIHSNALLLSKNAILSSSLAHEMGHCLGLYHTHSTAFGQELADGSTPLKGDGIADTPADPKLLIDGTYLVTANCEYSIQKQDSKGNVYTPDVTNIMSYSRDVCRTSFSKNQVERMRGIVLTSPILTPTLTSVEALLAPELISTAMLADTRRITPMGNGLLQVCQKNIDTFFFQPGFNYTITHDNTTSTFDKTKADVFITTTGSLQVRIAEIPGHTYTYTNAVEDCWIDVFSTGVQYDVGATSMVQQKPIYAYNSEQQLISSLSKGMHVLKIKTASGIIIERKIIKGF